MIKRLLISVCLLSRLHADNTETYWGKYTSSSPQAPIQFTITDSGITSFTAFGSRYDDKKVTLEFIGNHSGSEIFQIRFKDIHDNDNIIRCFSVIANDRVQLVTGFFMSYNTQTDNNISVKSIFPLTFTFSSRGLRP